MFDNFGAFPIGRLTPYLFIWPQRAFNIIEFKRWAMELSKYDQKDSFFEFSAAYV